MIPEIGFFTLSLSLGVALIQSVMPLIGLKKNNLTLMSLADNAAIMQVLLLSISFATLIHSFISSDFSVINVYQNSHTTKPLIYKITGVWGNHEGSLLLWVLILAIFGGAVVLFGNNLSKRIKAAALSVQGMIGLGFIAFIIFTSNPFERLNPVPLDGKGLNPLLQDPGLAIHPPMLYLGYVGFSMAFSFAIAALIEGKVDALWARWVRPWTLAAWTFLTVGIGLGSWWAYYELGWGGWWYWDPVENASFIPWLTGTALIHSLVVLEKRDSLKSWTILLAIVTFSLSLLGTFLVRSGVLTSVHAFASDPSRGIFILILLLITVGGSLTLYAIKAPKLDQSGVFSPISRESSLLINNIFLATSASTVLIGTLYPLVAESIGIGKISVGPPYFNMVFIPIFIPLIILMGIGPYLPWRKAKIINIYLNLKVVVLLTIISFVLFFSFSNYKLNDLAGCAGITLSAWVIFSISNDFINKIKLFKNPIQDCLNRARNLRRSAYGMMFAHIGVGLLIIGISGSSAWKQELIVSLKPGEEIRIAGNRIIFKEINFLNAANYQSLMGEFYLVEKQVLMKPERRIYNQPEQLTTEAAIHSNLWSDIYLVIGDGPNNEGAYTVRAFFEPFIPFLWYGVLIMGIGGILSLTDRSVKVTPKRSRNNKPVPKAGSV